MTALHYAVTRGGMVIYVGNEPALQLVKDYQLVELARQALCGRLVIPWLPESIEVTDHAWLLRLAGDAAHAAARTMA